MVKKHKIQIILPKKNIALNAINKSDLESLRKWKNINREFFFYKKVITRSEQREWYNKYTSTEDDYIFMVTLNGIKIGCMGYRKNNGLIDIYNVMLGKNEFARKGLMGRALRMLCSYLYDNIGGDITTKVIYDNQAKLWYRKNGFKEINTIEDYLLLKLDINNFNYLKYNLKID